MRKDIRTVTVGVDGSRAGLDAADWAAREAERRRLTLRLLHAGGEPTTSVPLSGAGPLSASGPLSGSGRGRAPASGPGPACASEPASTSEPASGSVPRPRVRSRPVPGRSAVPARDLQRGILDRAAVQLSYAHPTLEIAARRTDTPALPALLEAATESETVVLGSRGFNGYTRFLVGSVALAVAAGAACPVVLVRAGDLPQDERVPVDSGDDTTGPARTPYRPVVLGLDPSDPADELIGYAFDAAGVRAAPLHVVHTWTLPPLLPPPRDRATGVGAPGDTAAQQDARERSLAAVLEPWRHKFPETEVSEEVVYGHAGHHLLKASTRAGLLVVGRSTADKRLGRAAHSLLHRSTCPVAVVPHD
ncbi:universal stress protein [Streptomyces tauricus]|uniref:universal stress protein n=1 Tax=Streptomyces tauricus TaxID=68274 RepID=UPI0033A73AF8